MNGSYDEIQKLSFSTIRQAQGNEQLGSRVSDGHGNTPYDGRKSKDIELTATSQKCKTVNNLAKNSCKFEYS